jgi:class 3 adenylate cyclase
VAGCPNCGATTTPELRFCLNCGTALAQRCQTCGTPRVAGARFCGSCGTAFADGGTEATTSAASTDAGRGLGGARPGAGGGQQIPGGQIERRLVSILFADLVGFTTQSERSDPEAVREFLTRYFEATSQVIDRYGGTVEKFIGDAVMAVWGTPVAFEDDAERAVRAALDLVDAVRRLGPIDSTPGATPVDVRAAVMTGDAAVTVGATGQGMVAGDLVNSCSRLQAAADPGRVLVDEPTLQGARNAVAFEPAGEQNLRGKTLPLPAWHALRVVAERGGVGRTEGLEAPFVGREEELRLLKEQLHATSREGRARLVTIFGQPGMGKSRLVWEFQKYIDGVMETIYWHEGRSPSYGEGIAYWALGEMVRGRARINETEPVASALPKLTESVARWVKDESERAWVEPRLAALLGLAEAPTGDREELFAAWRRYFEGIAEEGTTVLLFEDLHWADHALLDFIESLMEWSRGKPILVIGLARPELVERRPAWGVGGRASVALHLEPVASDRMADMLAGLAPGLPQEAIAQIAERSEGVPLFAVETVRMLLDEGRLVREAERFRLVDAAVPFAVPRSLHALIAARLDSLDPDDRALIQDAAVLGKSFTVEAVAAVAGTDRGATEARLRNLGRKELVELDTDPRSPERGQYRFVHGLFREIAYGTLSHRDRRARHLAAARHFEALGDEELTGVLASHYLDAYRAAPEGPEGEAVAAQARIALRAAVDRALSLHAHATALGFIEEALSVTTDPGERAALWMRASEPAEASLGNLIAEDYLRRAFAFYEAEGDLTSLKHVTVRLSQVLLGVPRGRGHHRAHRHGRPPAANERPLGRTALQRAGSRLLLQGTGGACLRCSRTRSRDRGASWPGSRDRRSLHHQELGQ